MKKILLAVISLLPVLTYGQSMKIDPKQLMPGADGNVIITRNGVNVLDSLKWTDISNKPIIPTVNDATLTLVTSGIATGSQTWTANSSTDKTFTVNVPATNLSYDKLHAGVISSSTGTNATLRTLSTIDVRSSDQLATSNGAQYYMPAPADLLSNNFSVYFCYGVTPTADWSGVISVKPWTGNYGAWQLASRVGTSVENKLFYRNGVGSSWNAWKQIAFTDDIPTNNTQLTNGAGYITASQIPATPTLNQVTTAGNTTNIPIQVNVGNIAGGSSIISASQNGGSLNIANGTSQSGNFLASVTGNSTGANNGSGLYFIGSGFDSYANGAIYLSARNSTGAGLVTGGNIFKVSNYGTSKFTIDYIGNITIPTLGGGGNKMVTADGNGTLSTQPLITNNNQLTNGAGYITSSSLPTNYVTTNSAQTGITGNKSWDGAQTFNGNVTFGNITGTPSNFLYADVNGLIHATTLPSGSTSIISTSGQLQRAALTGDVTAAQNSNTTTIANNAVTFSKIQNIPTQTLMGRYGASTGNVQSITLGGGLSLNGSGVLSATSVNEIDDSGNFNYGYPTESYDGFDTKGGIANNIKEIAANTNYTVQRDDYSILFNAASTSDVTCYLPDPSQTPVGRILIISNFNTTYNITLNNIEGNNQGSYTMLKGAAIYIQNDGTKWRCILSANVGGF